MDDIVIHAETDNECLGKLKKVLDAAAEYGLKIKWKKCRFLQSSITFLGHQVGGGEIKPGPEKTKAIRKFPMPQNIKAVQSFLGFTGVFRKFIKNYSLIAKPLTNLLRKYVKFKMGLDEQQAVAILKEALVSEPVLRLYRRDAKTDAFAATLLQWHERQLHPVLFWSKKTSESEARQHSYIQEGWFGVQACAGNGSVSNTEIAGER